MIFLQGNIGGSAGKKRVDDPNWEVIVRVSPNHMDRRQLEHLYQKLVAAAARLALDAVYGERA